MFVIQPNPVNNQKPALPTLQVPNGSQSQESISVVAETELPTVLENTADDDKEEHMEAYAQQAEDSSQGDSDSERLCP